MGGRTESVDAPRQQGARLRHTVEYGEEAQRSGSGCSGARMPRYLRDGALGARPGGTSESGDRLRFPGRGSGLPFFVRIMANAIAILLIAYLLPQVMLADGGLAALAAGVGLGRVRGA